MNEERNENEVIYRLNKIDNELYELDKKLDYLNKKLDIFNEKLDITNKQINVFIELNETFYKEILRILSGVHEEE